jgi:hypothetical protein
LDCHIFIDKEILANFYPEEKLGFVKNKMKLKTKALKALARVRTSPANVTGPTGVITFSTNVTAPTGVRTFLTGVRSLSTNVTYSIGIRCLTTKVRSFSARKVNKNNNKQKTFTLNLENRD